MSEIFWDYLSSSGFGQFHWTNGVMILIGLLFIALAIRKGFEPLLLVPIGFGMLIGNIPYDASKLPLGVLDGPASPGDLHYYHVDIGEITLLDGTTITGDDYRQQWIDRTVDQLRAERIADLVRGHRKLDVDEATELAAQEINEQTVHFNAKGMIDLMSEARIVLFDHVRHLDDPGLGEELVHRGEAIITNKHVMLTPRIAGDQLVDNSVVLSGQGRRVFIDQRSDDDRYPEVWPITRQDAYKASVFYWLFAGIGIAGFYPPLIFLGIGALTDFGPMLSNPKTLLLGAAAQVGIFGALLAALLIFGFDMKEAASIGIIGGADGPTAIFTCSQLAPHLLGAVALAAYSYMAMVPLIQPPIMRLLTTREERIIRMPSLKPVSRRVRIIFPIIGFILTAFIAPGGLPLLGMLFLGNLLRESMVTERLAKTSQTTFIDIVTILLGVTVGAKTQAATFLTFETIGIFILGILAFCLATAAGLIFAKVMNIFLKEKINPLIGAAGVSAVPMAARVVHRVGLEEDPHNFLLMHAMGPNVAGVIGSAVAAGVMLSYFTG